ncbi:MAG: hypothetical protein MHMPM18_002094 [Marteilia pararefringens]
MKPRKIKLSMKPPQNKQNLKRSESTNSRQQKNSSPTLDIKPFVESPKTLDALIRLSAKCYKKYPYVGTIVESSADANVPGKKIIRYQTYQEVFEKSQSIASWLINEKQVENSQNTRIAFLVDNSAQTRVFYQSILLTKCICLPLYRALGEKSIVEMIRKSNCSVVICDDASKLKLTLRNLDILINLKLVIIYNFSLAQFTKDDSEAKKMLNSVKKTGSLSIVEYDEECQTKMLKSFPKAQAFEPPSPSDHAIIFCTSGSTGVPKLAIHSHASLHTTITGTVSRLYLSISKLNKPEAIRTYQILPEQHIFAANAAASLLCVGGTIVYPMPGTPAQMRENMKTDLLLVRPTLLAVVPLILSRLEKRVKQELSSGVGMLGSLRRKIFQMAYDYTCNDPSNNSFAQSSSSMLKSYISQAVFKKIRASFGNELSVFICGGAFLDESVAKFTETVTKAPVLQGYGLSECLAALRGSGQRGFHCGRELKGVDMVLKSVPEMGYFARDKKGEVCLKGSTLFKGYLGNKGTIDTSLNEEGYFETGDIGQIDADGNLRIIDRKKNIFKLAQGEFVSPTAIQDTYTHHPALKDVFIYGHFSRSCLVGIGFVDQESFTNWALQSNSRESSGKGETEANCKAKHLDAKVPVKDALNDPSIIEMLTANLLRFGEAEGLTGIERVRFWAFKCGESIPSIENNLLTVTMKQKRKVFEEFFHDDIEKLYSKAG